VLSFKTAALSGKGKPAEKGGKKGVGRAAAVPSTGLLGSAGISRQYIDAIRAAQLERVQKREPSDRVRDALQKFRNSRPPPQVTLPDDQARWHAIIKYMGDIIEENHMSSSDMDTETETKVAANPALFCDPALVLTRVWKTSKNTKMFQ
jgi:hypothetical protein